MLGNCMAELVFSLVKINHPNQIFSKDLFPYTPLQVWTSANLILFITVNWELPRWEGFHCMLFILSFTKKKKKACPDWL
jgi:hypothetical protein